MSHSKPIAIGLNCALGAKDMVPYIDNLSRNSNTWVFCLPQRRSAQRAWVNTTRRGLMAEDCRVFPETGLINAIGGCCGTTDEHIKCLADMVGDFQAPRKARCH